ncbi:resuscitation-promoting factor [Blastococcus sp. VKM Ac-2987]|uniref:resuscitation-promoting factor n=1 Tax=Blastococcus sp. VKM Ac-2987 TaxID=3004141 RepID=UPI0022AB79A8|nr:resuscitation-promoting factor [Blastococcus sp. VKM Ac-2987]MCZ2858137.1 ubiquitin-like domain-containing protein [Blastococcus sp. VKM Ac-2987]
MRRSLQFSLFALVLLGLVGGTLAFFLAQKSVVLTIDGQAREVGTYADTVGDVLEEEGLTLAAQDVVLPAADQRVSDGSTVVLNRARPLELTIDGVSRQVQVTALSVEEALDQLGLRAEGLVLSASRSDRLPLEGMQLTITTPKDIVLVADGAERVVTTTAATAGDLLAEQGIALSDTDRTSLKPTQALLNRMRLQVYRVQVSDVTEVTPVAHGRVEAEDAAAFQGDETVTRPGVDGEQSTTYRVTVVDGQETGREQLSTSVTRAPVDELVTVGTKARPTNRPSADGLNWAALAACESGGRPTAVSGTGKYHGLYQFSTATWQGVGGSGLPSAASPDEQTYRAQLLYQRSGAGQWPHCGPRLFS